MKCLKSWFEIDLELSSLLVGDANKYGPHETLAVNCLVFVDHEWRFFQSDYLQVKLVGFANRRLMRFARPNDVVHSYLVVIP